MTDLLLHVLYHIIYTLYVFFTFYFAYLSVCVCVIYMSVCVCDVIVYYFVDCCAFFVLYNYVITRYKLLYYAALLLF